MLNLIRPTDAALFIASQDQGSVIAAKLAEFFSENPDVLNQIAVMGGIFSAETDGQEIRSDREMFLEIGKRHGILEMLSLAAAGLMTTDEIEEEAKERQKLR